MLVGIQKPKFWCVYRNVSKINDGHLTDYEFTSQFYIINVRKIFKNSSIDRKLFDNSFVNLQGEGFQNNIWRLPCKNIFKFLSITGPWDNFCFASYKNLKKKFERLLLVLVQCQLAFEIRLNTFWLHLEGFC